MSNHSIGYAGDFIVLKTNPDKDASRLWAQTTANQIIQPQEGIHEERIQKVERLRRTIVEVLEPYFRTGNRNEEAFKDVLKCVSGSEWELPFSNPSIRAEIFMCLTRNLNTVKGN